MTRPLFTTLPLSFPLMTRVPEGMTKTLLLATSRVPSDPMVTIPSASIWSFPASTSMVPLDVMDPYTSTLALVTVS